MYYYAYINIDTGFCHDVIEAEEPMNDPAYIELTELQDPSYAAYAKIYAVRKTYENGVWRDTTVEEAEAMYATNQGERITIGNEWLNVILDNKAQLEHTHAGYATTDHVHTEYADSDDLQVLEDIVNTKADSNHTHDGYAEVNHSHSEYATQTFVDELEMEVNSKANVSHSHTEYALNTHEHDNYASMEHNHNSAYAPLIHSHTDYVTMTDFDALETEVDGKASSAHTHTASEIGAATNEHNHDNDYAGINHNHDSAYSALSHSHANYVTTDTLEAEVEGKANVNHSHNNYSEITHNHDSVYSDIAHNHDEDYSVIDHAHANYATTASLSELSAVVSGKADASHGHDDRYYTEAEINTKLSTKADSSHTHTGVYDVSGAAASALSSANVYTDEAIDALSETVATKANTSALTSHTGNTTVHITSTERTNWNTAKTHADSAHAPANAEPNQNAFSNIVVGNTTISADTKTDSLTLVAGNNVTITPDSTGDSITISSANTVYTHPTSVGNKHIPAGGSSGQILRWSADGTAVWGNDNNTTYSNATQSSSGLMGSDDKTKLDGIAEGANNYTLPSAGTNLGGVKSGGDVTISSGLITVNDDSHNHVISNIDGLQSALDSKAASGHTHSDVYTETEVDAFLEGKANTSHTHTIANITNLQSTLNGKAATSHGTHVSYSTTAPVMDGSASVGTASTVARSDHKHPTDTSRAAQTSLDSHTGNKSNPHGVTLAQLGLTATAAELNTLDGITATVTELNYVDGVTSNIQTQLNSKAASGHTHNYAGSSSAGGAATSANKLNANAGDANTPVYFANGIPVACTSLDLNTTGSSASCTGNAATATKLETARTIALGTGVTGTATNFNGTGNITIPVTDVKESYLSWGGKNLTGSVSPIGAALSTEHSANRIAYLNPAAVKVEYSNDAGSTWTDSGLGNSAKINLVTTSNAVSVGSNSTVTTNHRTRITLTGQDGTNGYVYTRPHKMLINVSTPHGLTVTVEAKTGVSGASWTTLGTYALSGWSGWNDIPMSISTFGGGTNQTSNYWYIRLTFANTSVNSSYTTTKSSIIGLRLFGDTCWTRTSNMGETGHLYSYDSSQNATFPANVTATTLSGTTFSGSGVATLAEVQTYLGI